MAIAQTVHRAFNAEAAVSIPIIDRSGHVVGWTSTPPTSTAGRIQHPDAAKLLSGEITTRYIELDDPKDAARAGAPGGWTQPWRCFAICEVA